MIKIDNEFNEAVYQHKTTSGLSLIYIHRPGFKKSAAVLGVPFGALNIEQVVDGKKISHPLGVAHFLEHKVFEDEHEDILSQFSKIGGSANAFTSYHETMYYFNHETELLAPLKLLLQFVRRFDIDEQSVEKEKPIIVEEIKMYEQMPEMRLIQNTYQNVFHEFPYIYDIAGTPETVNETTLADLQRAYNLNYADDNMTLVVIGNEAPEALFAFVEKHTQNRNTTKHNLENIYPNEPSTIVHEHRELEDRTQNTKMSLCYKFAYPKDNHLMDEMILKFVLDMNFSDLNDDYQTLLDEDIISDFFGYDIDLKEDFGVIYFFNESEKVDAFKKFIDHKMNHLILDESLFVQIKRKTYGDMIYSLSNFERLAVNMARYALQDKDYLDFLKDVKNIEFSQISPVLELLEDKECSLFVLKNKDV